MSQANNRIPAGDRQRTPRLEAQITELAAESTREPSSRNHRCGPRAAVELDVSLGSDHNFYAGFVENLSAGGVFVATHLLRPVGEVIELSIHISDDDAVVTGTGEVRWLREYNEASDVPPGMGVKFLTLANGAQKIIEKFLAQRDPLFFDDDDNEPSVVTSEKPPAPALSEKPAAAVVSEKPAAAVVSEKPAAAVVSENPPVALSEKPAAAVVSENPPAVAVSENPPVALSEKPAAAVVSENPPAAAAAAAENPSESS